MIEVGTLRYRAGDTARRPVAALRRRRHPQMDPLGVAMLDAHRWRRSMLECMGAAGVDPGLLTDADLDPDAVVIDVGAYVGEWAVEVADRHGVRVISFEPSRLALDQLRRRCAGRDDVVVHPVALGATDAVLRLAEEGPGSTLHAGDGTFGDIDVEVRDAASVFDELGLWSRGIDLMKVNIEGGEYDLLERLWETGWLERTSRLLVQFHEWLPHAHRRRRAIRRHLSVTHDERWCHDWVWELWDRRP